MFFFVRIDKHNLVSVGELMWENAMYLVSEKATQILRIFFLNYSELCFVISEKEKRHYKTSKCGLKK